MDIKRFFVYLLQFQVSNPLIFLIYWLLLETFRIIQDILIILFYLGTPPYLQKVHAKKILLRRKPQRWHLQFDTDFLVLHQGFCETAFLTMNDNIHLYSLDKRIARFVKVPPEVDVLDSRMFPTYSHALFQHATHLYEFPTELAIKLAEDVSMSDIPVVLFGNTGRCGSTLLTNVFNETGKTAVLSNHVLFSPWTWLLRDGFPEEEIKPLIRCGIKFILKHRGWLENKELCFINPYSEDVFILSLIKQVFPQFKLLFQYRNGLKTIRSFERINHDYWPEIYYKWPPVIRFMIRTAHKYWLCMDDELTLHLASSSRRLMFCAVWATKMKCYLKLQSLDDSIRATTYEDLVQNREKCISDIFKFCGLDPKLSVQGIRALDYDSQRGWIERTKNAEATSMDERTKRIADQICDLHGVPRLSVYVKIAGHL